MHICTGLHVKIELSIEHRQGFLGGRGIVEIDKIGECSEDWVFFFSSRATAAFMLISAPSARAEKVVFICSFLARSGQAPMPQCLPFPRRVGRQQRSIHRLRFFHVPGTTRLVTDQAGTDASHRGRREASARRAASARVPVAQRFGSALIAHSCSNRTHSSARSCGIPRR